MKSDLWLYVLLIAMGLGWGLTIPLASFWSEDSILRMVQPKLPINRNCR